MVQNFQIILNISYQLYIKIAISKSFVIFVETLKLTVMERFSMREVIKQKYGEAEKGIKCATASKRATKKAEKKDTGKYVTKIVDGVKYMVLK
jgi:hypothetical protein